MTAVNRGRPGARQAGEQQRPGEHQLLGGDGAGRILHRHHGGARRSEHGE
ncbi:hypothetical protein [Mesorhizobium sp. M0047]